MVTSLERCSNSSNASMVLIDARNPRISGEEEIQERAVGFLLNK
jgi:hypothetical protein